MIQSLLPIAAQATAEDPHHEVPLSVTIFFAGILVAMIICLALEEKLHAKKSVIVGVFAGLSLLLGAAFDLLPFGAVENSFHERLEPLRRRHVPLRSLHVDRHQTHQGVARRPVSAPHFLRDHDRGFLGGAE